MIAAAPLRAFTLYLQQIKSSALTWRFQQNKSPWRARSGATGSFPLSLQSLHASGTYLTESSFTHPSLMLLNLPLFQEKEFLLKLIPSNERKSKLGKYASVRWRHMEDDERQLYQDLEKFAWMLASVNSCLERMKLPLSAGYYSVTAILYEFAIQVAFFHTKNLGMPISYHIDILLVLCFLTIFMTLHIFFIISISLKILFWSLLIHTLTNFICLFLMAGCERIIIVQHSITRFKWNISFHCILVLPLTTQEWLIIKGRNIWNNQTTFFDSLNF